MRTSRRILTSAALVGAVLVVMLVASRQAGRVSANGDSKTHSPNSMFSRPLPDAIAAFPEGTRIHIRLEEAISTETNTAGDHFEASLDTPLIARGKALAPIGSKIVGQLTGVHDAASGKGPSQLTFVLQSLTVNGDEHSLRTEPLTFSSQATLNKNAAGPMEPDRRSRAAAHSSGAPLVLDEPLAYGPESRFSFTLAQTLELPIYPQ